VRGIIGAGGYVPYRRIDRSEITTFFGSGGGRGTRSVASYDEDTTSMGVEAARFALRSAPAGAEPQALWFATANPAYLEKTNANVIHDALRLDQSAPAIDTGGAVRSGIGTLRAALDGRGTALVVTADMRGGLPTSTDEAAGGDGAAALLVGDDDAGPVIAELVGAGSATEEFIDRWRTPGDATVKQWEERFGETKYLPLGEQAWNAALKAAEVSPEQVGRFVVSGTHARANRSIKNRLGTAKEAAVDDLSTSVGNTGTAQAGLLLAAALETAEPGQIVALVSLVDGADVLVFRVTDAIASYTPARPVATQVEQSAGLPYGRFLAWRRVVTLDPPRRPEPDRISAAVAGRTREWKYAFVGSRDESSGALHLPPARVSREGGAIDEMQQAPMSDVPGTIATFTIDRIAYSPSPPIVFAIVDFDEGGRLPIELTDVEVDELQLGTRVEMTFRRLFSADGLYNYFWKARPIRG
jgi:hydroxymethylglutaryl-CoA synthase